MVTNSIHTVHMVYMCKCDTCDLFKLALWQSCTVKLRYKWTKIYAKFASAHVYSIRTGMHDLYVWAKLLFLLFLKGHCCFNGMISCHRARVSFILNMHI